MSILGILLLCYTFWPLTLLIFFVCFVFGGAVAAYAGIKVAPYVMTGILFLYQTFRSSVLEPATHSIAANIRASFPIVQAQTQPPVALYAWHPHGLYAIAPFLHTCSTLTDWKPPSSVALAAHSYVASIPLINTMPIQNRIIAVNEDTLSDTIASGSSVCIVPGGVRESFCVHEKRLSLVLKSRTGMFRIAADKNVPIVPVLVFGENDMFLPAESAFCDWYNAWLNQTVGFQLPLPKWSCVTRWFSLLQKPFDTPVKTVFGEPVYPVEKETVDEFRTRYIDSLDKLYAAHKPAGWADTINYV